MGCCIQFTRRYAGACGTSEKLQNGVSLREEQIFLFSLHEEDFERIEESVTVMNFDYFYGEQSEAFAFYRTPQVFYTDEKFRKLSSDAKTLYGILLDRVALSRRCGWLDEEGRVYVYMTVKSVETSLGCAHQKACGLLSELEEFGLIERVKQRLCKPDRIYVKNFIQVWNSYSRKYENHTAGGMKIIPTEVWKSYPNNTDINKTEKNNTNPILSGWDVDKDERSPYREILFEQLEIDALYERYPYEKESINSILDLILDTVCSKRELIRIAGDDKPKEVVKSQFLKLNSMHFEYVLSCLRENASDVRNIKQYLLATIYNAPFTMTNYFRAKVNHDMAGGGNSEN